MDHTGSCCNRKPYWIGNEPELSTCFFATKNLTKPSSHMDYALNCTMVWCQSLSQYWTQRIPINHQFCWQTARQRRDSFLTQQQSITFYKPFTPTLRYHGSSSIFLRISPRASSSTSHSHHTKRPWRNLAAGEAAHTANCPGRFSTRKQSISARHFLKTKT